MKINTTLEKIFILIFLIGTFFSIIDINHDRKLKSVSAEVIDIGFREGLGAFNYANVTYIINGKKYLGSVRYKNYNTFYTNGFNHDLVKGERIMVYYVPPSTELTYPYYKENIYIICFLLSIIIFPFIMKRKKNENNKIMLNIEIVAIIIEIFLITLSILTGSIGKINNINISKKDSLVIEKEAEMYGDYVEYNCDLNNNGDIIDDWKLFYIDKNTDKIYLIASNYLPQDKIPKGVIDTSQNKKSNLVSNDSNNINISENLKKNFFLNPNNMIPTKKTRTMLNQSYWSEFKDSRFSDIEVIGGPTLDLWIASWNAKGYIQLHAEKNTADILDISINNLYFDSKGSKDSLFFLENNADIKGYWLASSSYLPASSGGDLFIVHEAKVDDYSPNCVIGFRPVVCIGNKSYIEREKNILKIQS